MFRNLKREAEANVQDLLLAKKDLEENSWGDHPKKCPKCGETLVMKEFIVPAYSTTKSTTLHYISDGFTPANRSSFHIYVVHCSSCLYQKRTFERFHFSGMKKE